MFTVQAPDGVPEVTEGADLAALLLPLVELADGDIVTVTSKVVSKAEGRAVTGERAEWIDTESLRLVAQRGETRIVRNRLGLTMAAAGVDGSHVAAGTSLLLPLDPDASARRLRSAIRERAGVNVGVLVTDTAGRPWREGQTDIAIGAAGLEVLESFAGQVDAHGNELAVTAPAVADELASAAELASGKLGGRPFAVIRGRADLVSPIGDHGPGAGLLIRADGADLFGYGAREAVIRAIEAEQSAAAAFGAPVAPEELVVVLERIGVHGSAATGDAMVLPELPDTTLRAVAAVAFAHGWRIDDTEVGAPQQLRPLTP